MTEYSEIEDPREIRQLNNLLATKLKRALPHTETRTIGYPRGTFETTVRFRTKSGTNILYWSGKTSNKKKARNFLGHGTPGETDALTIDVQFNVPILQFSRAFGGVFLRDISTGSIVLAHRGIVTLGHGRVPKEELFTEMVATLREVPTSEGSSDLLLISELESPTLIEELDAFSSELRRAARMIKLQALNHRRGRSKHSSAATAMLAGKLRQYFDESSGRRQIKGRRQSIADCYHGTVVRAIRDAFGGSAETLKNQAIDLTVVASNRIYLFEVKTSSQPQDVYTAIGQLAAHAPTVAQYAPEKTLIRVIVLPALPNRRLQDVLVNQLDIRLLIFTRSSDGRVAINGLKLLK